VTSSLSIDNSKRKGSLIVAGSGMTVGQFTQETVKYIKMADSVPYCVADPVTERYIKSLNHNSEDLFHFYSDSKPRIQTYREMVGRILDIVCTGKNVCTVFYGHPGVFVYAGHKAIERLREDGYEAWMLPAVSSLDCMFSDLGIDPAWDGCHIFEATQFLTRARRPDVNVGLILLQVGALGDAGFKSRGFDGRYVPILVSYLEKFYDGNHELVVYQAAQFSVSKPLIRIVRLKDLAAGADVGVCTVYVPPIERAQVDKEMVQRFFNSGIVSESTK